MLLSSFVVLSSTGIGVRTKRSKNSVNQSRRSGCSLGTCTVHDLAHRLHILNNKNKVSSAPADKISPLGYGRRRRAVPDRQMKLDMQGGHLKPVWRLHKLDALLRRTWAGRQPRGLHGTLRFLLPRVLRHILSQGERLGQQPRLTRSTKKNQQRLFRKHCEWETETEEFCGGALQLSGLVCKCMIGALISGGVEWTGVV